jgi:hypothetical protein
MKVLNIILTSAILIGCIDPPVGERFEWVEEETIIYPVEEVQLDPLVRAIIYVESRGNDSAVGDNGRSVGCLQIQPIAVREANRLLGRDEYCLEDRWSRSRSIEMFNVIRDRTPFKTDEKIARNWNGGCNGCNKKSTLKYWRKVKKRLHSQK